MWAILLGSKGMLLWFMNEEPCMGTHVKMLDLYKKKCVQKMHSLWNIERCFIVVGFMGKHQQEGYSTHKVQGARLKIFEKGYEWYASLGSASNDSGNFN